MAKKNQGRSNSKQEKKKYITEEVLDASNELAEKTESFIEKNAKILGGIFGVLVVGALAYFAYLKYIVEPKTEEGFLDYYQAQKAFEQDSLQQAMYGSATGGIGFEGVVDEYGSTKPGNLAKYNAGIIAYREGDYETALKYLEDFDADEPAALAQKNGMIGNALVESGALEDGLKYYVKAAEATDLEVFQTMYYTKAGQLAIELDKNEEALTYFKTLEENFPEANGGTALKYIEMLKYKTATE